MVTPSRDHGTRCWAFASRTCKSSRRARPVGRGGIRSCPAALMTHAGCFTSDRRIPAGPTSRSRMGQCTSCATRPIRSCPRWPLGRAGRRSWCRSEPNVGSRPPRPWPAKTNVPPFLDLACHAPSDCRGLIRIVPFLPDPDGRPLPGRLSGGMIVSGSPYPFVL